jgi:hypothetical protein
VAPSLVGFVSEFISQRVLLAEHPLNNYGNPRVKKSSFQTMNPRQGSRAVVGSNFDNCGTSSALLQC